MVESEMEETGRHTHTHISQVAQSIYTLLLIVADSSVLLNIHSVAIYFCTRDVFPFFFGGGGGGGEQFRSRVLNAALTRVLIYFCFRLQRVGLCLDKAAKSLYRRWQTKQQ
jgi:hypothetical protein